MPLMMLGYFELEMHEVKFEKTSTQMKSKQGECRSQPAPQLRIEEVSGKCAAAISVSSPVYWG